MEGQYHKFFIEYGMLLLAFLCPFMLYIPLPLDDGGFSIFSATLIVHFYHGYIHLAPLYYPLFNFFMWLPYVYIGYEYRKLVTGQMQDPKGLRETNSDCNSNRHSYGHPTTASSGEFD